MKKLKFTEDELALIADCLGAQGNVLNKEFKQMQNYFRANHEASLEYVLESLEVTKQLIEICETQIKIVKRLSATEKGREALKDLEENLEIYRDALVILSNPTTAYVQHPLYD